MKKIGILTFHFADSYGALLQTYALKKTIDKLPRCKAEIINYIPEHWKFIPYVNSLDGRLAMIEKRKLYQGFIKNYLGVEGEVLRDVTGNEYDYYCVGSDQVWNSTITQCDGYFLPHISSDAKKISYAASMGNSLDDEKLDKDVFKKYLPTFKNISVREKGYGRFVSEITGKECACVLDPTLLLDYKEYDEIVAKKQFGEPFLFLFWLNKEDEHKGIELANLVARKYNLTIIHSILGTGKYTFYRDGGCMIYEGIEDFLWFMKNATFVITDSYHGTMFSLQYRKPFYTLVFGERRSRIDTVRDNFGLQDRIIEKQLFYSDINDYVDFYSIWQKIYDLRDKSIEYLKNSLEV